MSLKCKIEFASRNLKDAEEIMSYLIFSWAAWDEHGVLFGHI